MLQGTPLTGRFFEKLIRSVKRCLKKTLGSARKEYEQVLTVIKEIEMVSNNRPETYSYTESFYRKHI